MTYLDSVIYQRLVVFKDQQQIRSLSKAIEIILGEYFQSSGSLAVSDSSHLLNRNVLKQNELLTETIRHLTDVIESQTHLYRHLQLFQILKLSRSDNAVIQKEDKNDPVSEVSVSIDNELEQYLHSIGLSLHMAQQGLTGVQLAARLQVSSSALSRRRSTSGFTQWSRQVDPKGVGWKFVGETRRFHPLVEYDHLGKVDSKPEVSQMAGTE